MSKGETKDVECLVPSLKEERNNCLTATVNLTEIWECYALQFISGLSLVFLQCRKHVPKIPFWHLQVLGGLKKAKDRLKTSSSRDGMVVKCV